MKKIKHVFTETGEVRKVQRHDYFLTDDHEIRKSDFINPSSYEYPILDYERIEEEWKPKEGDKYYYITAELSVYWEWENHCLSEKRIKVGNCFPTKELAEEKLKQIKDILKGVTQ